MAKELAEAIVTAPILFSFRRCPYAIRARMALFSSNIQFELREVDLKNKPQSLINHSPKATLPVLVLIDGTVIDESLDVMLWALGLPIPQCLSRFEDKHVDTKHPWLLLPEEHTLSLQLIKMNDQEFKPILDHYKYADRFPEKFPEDYRQQAEDFLSRLEQRLNQNRFLFKNVISLADVAIFPFIRQFAFVDKTWFDQSPYPKLQRWLAYFLESSLFLTVMTKYPAWQQGDKVKYLP